MATAQATLLAAYVLHHHDWSDTSLIVDLFTRELGRVPVVAKGAKRANSQLRAVLMPFHALNVQLSKAPAEPEATELRNLRAAHWHVEGGHTHTLQPLAGQQPMPADALLAAFYLNELLLKGLARQDPHPVLFDTYGHALQSLKSNQDEAPVLRAFELHWLRQQGLLPDLTQVGTTAQALLPDRLYALDPEQALVPQSEGVPGHVWCALEAQLSEPTAAGFAALTALCAVYTAALRPGLQSLVHYHLGTNHLRTRQLSRGVQRLFTSSPVPTLS